MSGLDTISSLAALVGIAPSHTDAFGYSVGTSAEVTRALLSGFGLDVGTEHAARETLTRLTRRGASMIPPLIVSEAGQLARVPLRGVSGRAGWALVEESGAARDGAVVEGQPFLDVPALAAGYHQLTVGDAKATMIVAPARCWEPREFDQAGRLWGAAAQIYSLRSADDLGIGTYTDVALAAEGVATVGGDFLGLSPVHALFEADRSKISPYSPSSRLMLESLHIDPAAIEGYRESGAAKLLDVPEARQLLARLKDSALVDHAALWDLKRPLLDAIWSAHSDRKQPEFEAFRAAQGNVLEAHAAFEAISEHFRHQGRWWLGDWPRSFQDAQSEEVRRFQADRAERVAFHAWLQFIADQQLADASSRARRAGMAVGLYRDLAVGADRGGSEIWANPNRFSTALSIGAPPDPLGPQGQDWGLPPLNPLVLEAGGLASFRDLVRANMRHAGAIRIDHAFQLSRLFLIPSGARATEGAYVAYPFEAMLAVLRLESHRARCVVIAEDLGTAPEGFSAAIMASGLLSYRVLPFEREKSGAFTRPERYPHSALAALGTHDLPTFRGWWRGLDIELRETFGVFDGTRAEAERAARSGDRRQLAETLHAEGLLPVAELPSDAPFEAAIRYLARTPAVLLGLQMEDLSGELNQANMPGIDAGHPNWRRRLAVPIETLMAPDGRAAEIAAALTAEGRGAGRRPQALAASPPRATYRLQFHDRFTFEDAVRIVPYLAKLGISHLYASPIQTARAGSTHGYDIVDHAAINPELGGEDGFRRLALALKANGLRLLLDIVPNHMGIGGADNRWWLSVLEWGRLSPFADAFDIDWERPGAGGKVIVPFLGGARADVLANGELKLAFDPVEGAFSLWHGEHRFPLCPATYPLVINAATGIVGGPTRAAMVNERFDRTAMAGPADEVVAKAEESKRRLADAAAADPTLRNTLEAAVASINGSQDRAALLDRILGPQAYRLAHWREASSVINYRRFFEVDTLAGLQVERPEIFERVHELIFRLVEQGDVDGLRIDHIDGLADPERYLRAVQDRVGPGFYIAVEKILQSGEELRAWPVAGTTGYDVLNLIDGVLVDHGAGETFERIYREAVGPGDGYAASVRQLKIELCRTSFASELEVLVAHLHELAQKDPRTQGHGVPAIREALLEIIAAFPHYRSYLDHSAPRPDDIRIIEDAVADAKARSAGPDRGVHDFIADALLRRIGPEGGAGRLSELSRRFQQLTGPVMAKSVEDTLFYRDGRLIALNEVGGEPDRFGVTTARFHAANAARAREWPHALIATATHDTKRGEDARARLLAVSEMPQEWQAALAEWREVVTPHLSQLDGGTAPDANDQIILFQTLLGAWPVELLDGEDAAALAGFCARVEAFALKAIREAKRRTSWIEPDEAYEKATLGLLKTILGPAGTFGGRFRPLLGRLSFLGMLNGLSRTVLKATLPGVPDIYQGAELWDFALVDPDNRRPVDYGIRAAGLNSEEPLSSLLSNWQDGRIKQHILARLLRDRANAPLLYAGGDYRPLPVAGPRAAHLIAFARRHGAETLAVVVPRLWSRLAPSDGFFDESPVWSPVWRDTVVGLPRGDWRDVLTGRAFRAEGDVIPAGDLFDLPLCVLRAARSR